MSRASPSPKEKSLIARRFRGFLPVVIDVETGGFNPQTDGLLEIAAVMLEMDEKGYLVPCDTIARHVRPFEGANLEQSALDFTGINPFHPLRIDVPEPEALEDIFRPVRRAIKSTGCSRAILVGHNAAFDLSFVRAAAERNRIKRDPFHPFSCLDTVSLSALAYGQTVLSKSCEAAGISFDNKQAHSARYDCERTAELFCTIINRWKSKAGWQGD